jgi:hypothetical protein
MRADIIAGLLGVAFFACLTVLDLRSKTPSRVNLLCDNQPPPEPDGHTDEPDAYKVAVVLSVGAAILTLIA